MKNSIRLCSGLIVTSFLFSCNSRTPDSVKNAKEVNAQRIETENRPDDSTAIVLTRDDADFLVNTASGVMLEAEIGQLAMDRSDNQRVKALGAMIVRDHKEAEARLKKLAATKNVTLPADISNHQQKQKESLLQKKGIEFDRSYIDLTVNDYNKDIKDFGKVAKYGTDPEIKSFASNSLPLLYTHLDSARNLQKEMKKRIDISTAVPK